MDHSAGAYVSSVHACESLKEGLLPHGNVQVDITSAIALLRQKVAELAPEEVPGMTQKMISLEIDKNLKVRLAASLTDKRDKAKVILPGITTCWGLAECHPFTSPWIACKAPGVQILCTLQAGGPHLPICWPLPCM